MKKIIYFFIFFFITQTSNSHVDHYKNLNKLEYNLYRNDKLIGKHIYTFTRNNEDLTVSSQINFEIKKLGVLLYHYHAEGTEIYKNDDLIKFTSKTNQNKKEKYVNIKLQGDKYIIDGSSYKGDVSSDFIIGTWWNHEIVKARAQISAVSGRIIEQKVTFIGKEKIKINDKEITTLHFNFSSTDKKLSKDKKLNTDVWYDEKTLTWVKASFKKSGVWEYRLALIK